MKPRRVAAFGIASLALLVGVVGGDIACSLALDHSASQCETTVDCQARGPAFARLICSEKHVCVSEGGCNTNAECQAANGGQPYICRKADRTCVSLTSKECTQLISEPTDIADDNTIWVGSPNLSAVVPTNDAGQPLQPTYSLGYRVAREEISKLGRGLPPVNPGGPRRPLALVLCDDTDPTTLPRILQHLVGDLRVPVIFGDNSSNTLTALTTSTVQAGVLTLSGSATAPSLAQVQTNGLFLRTAASDEQSVDALAAYLATVLEPQLRSGAKPGLGSGEQLRVAVVHKGDTLGLALSGRAASVVKFNGKSVNDNGSNFLDSNYGDPNDPNNTTPAALFAKSVADTLAFKPHVILAFGSNGDMKNLAPQIEAQWPAGASRPYYLANTGPGSELSKLVGANQDWASRIISANQALDRSTPDYAAYAATVNGEFSGTPGGPSIGGTNQYDIFYALAYGIVAVGGQPLTGANIAKGMRSHQSGRPLNTGGAHIFDVYSALAAGDKIDLRGVATTLKWDNNGDVFATIELDCPKTAPSDGGIGPSIGLKPTGLVYDATSKTITGTATATCPGP